MDKKRSPSFNSTTNLGRKLIVFFGDMAHFLSILIVDGKSLGNLKKRSLNLVLNISQLIFDIEPLATQSKFLFHLIGSHLLISFKKLQTTAHKQKDKPLNEGRKTAVPPSFNELVILHFVCNCLSRVAKSFLFHGSHPRHFSDSE